MLLLIASLRLSAQTNGNLPAALQPSSSSIYGRVINAVTGGPVPRALIQSNDSGQLTDNEGRFRFEGLSLAGASGGGSIAVRVNKPGYYGDLDGSPMLTRTLSVTQASGDITLRLYPEAVISGTVTTSDGRPVSHLLVMARRNTYSVTSNQWLPVGQHQTNARGEFRLTVPSGDYRVETGYFPQFEGGSRCVLPTIYPQRGPSGADSPLHITAGTEQRIDLRVTASPTYPVEVHVEPQSENGMPPMMIARSASGISIPVGVARSSPGVQPRIELPLGTYTLVLHNDSREIRQYAETAVTVTGPATAPVTLRLVPVPSIPLELTVDSAATSDNKPPTPQQFGLVLVPADPESSGGIRSVAGGPRGISQGAEDQAVNLSATPGIYRLVSLSGGRWYLRSASYGGTDLLQHELVIGSGASSTPLHLTVSDQTGSATGTVRVNGTPAAAWIYCVPLGPSSTPVYTIRSSATGTFNFPYLPPGSYRAIAFENSHQDDYRSSERLAQLASWTRSFSVTAGNKSTVDLDAVPIGELTR